MPKQNKSIIGAVIGAAIISVIALFPVKDKTFTHVNYKERSAVHVVIVSGHGSILNSIYQTPGKQSPTWSDSLKIYEGYSCKLLAYNLAYKLTSAGIDVTYINNYNTDMSLYDRAVKVNELWSLDKRILFISLHHNAQNASTGDYTDFEGQKGFTSISSGGASGIDIFTSPGLSESDNFADNYLLPQLKGTLLQCNFRNKGKSREANFYVLTKTKCPAVLIEFNFMTTYKPDCLQIQDPTIRNNYTTAIATAVINYNTSKNK